MFVFIFMMTRAAHGFVCFYSLVQLDQIIIGNLYAVRSICVKTGGENAENHEFEN